MNISNSAFFGVVLSLVWLDSLAAEVGENLCSKKEIVVASCGVGRKILSFCSNQDGSVVAYRYGVKTKIELGVIFSPKNPLSRWVDAATYTTYLGFRRGKYSYSFGIPQETLGAKAFLDISRSGSLVSSQLCTGNSAGKKNLIGDAIVEVDDNVVRDGGFIFPLE